MRLLPLFLLAAWWCPLLRATSCINTVAGGATSASASTTDFRSPAHVAAASDGTLYLSSQNAIYASQIGGSTIVVAGEPDTAGFADGAAAATLFSNPQALVFVPAISSLLIADYLGRRVRLLNLSSGMVSTVMGTGAAASTGDGGAPAAAALMTPFFLAVSPTTGDVFVGDMLHSCVRRASYGGAANIGSGGGTMSTVAGTCGSSNSSAAPPPGALAAASTPLFGRHSGVAVDTEGTLYVSDSAGPWRVNLASGIRTLLLQYVNLVSGWANVVTSLTVREDPTGAMTPPGRLLLLTTSTSAFMQVLAVGPLPQSPGALSVFHNNPNSRAFTGDGLPALNASTDALSCVNFDPFSRNVYIVASSSVAIRKVGPDGIINTVLRGTKAAAAGSSDGQLAIAATLNGPRGIAIAPNGDIFFAEAAAAKVRVLRANGLLGTVAGSGVVGFSGDGGPATAAALNFPYGLALFPNGDLVIAQSSSGCLRLVKATTGIITTLYGKCGVTTSSGDGGPASAATFASTHSVAIDAAGGMYICETMAFVIRYVNPTTGIITRFAGSGRAFGPPQWTWDPSQEGGPALAVDLLYPLVIVLNPAQTHLFFTDFVLEAVYEVNIASGILKRVLGLPYDSVKVPPLVPVSPNPPSLNVYNSIRADGVAHQFGLTGPAVNASFTGFSGSNGKVTSSILGLAFTRSGLLLVSSSYDNLLLSLNLSSGLAEVLAGTGKNLRAGDGGSPLEASLFTPRFLAVDAADNVFFTESGSSTVREISQGSTPNCPEGFVCPCGLRPAPCTSPSSFCPRGSAAALPASPGFFTVAVAAPGGGAVYAAQAPCPLGSYCSAGVRVPCAAGSYGTRAGQAAQASCVQCSPGTYVAVPGAAAPPPAPPPCLPVPAGFITLGPGAAFPAPCPAFTSRAQGLAGCAPCAPMEFAPPGSAACIPLDESTDTASVVGAVLSFQRSFAVDDGTITPAALNRLYLLSAVPIFGFFTIPLIIYLLLPLIPFCVLGARSRAWFETFLEDADLYCAMEHDVKKNESPINRPTPVGGALSVVFLGVLIAFCVMTIEQFATANTVTILGSLELTAFETSQIFSYPTFANKDPIFDAIFPGGVAAGLALAVRAAGPRCSSVLANGTTAFLSRGAWEPTASSYDTATGASVHVLRCPQCMVDALSKLELLFDASCGSLEVSALTVGGWGTLSFASFSANNVSSAAATLTISAQSVLDFVAGADPESSGYPTGGRSMRGLFISAIDVDALEPYNATAVALGVAPPVRLLLRLPAAPLFSRYTMHPSMSVLELLSNLVGNLGVVGGAAVAFGVWLRLREACARRARRAEHKSPPAALPAAEAVMD